MIPWGFLDKETETYTYSYIAGAHVQPQYIYMYYGNAAATSAAVGRVRGARRTVGNYYSNQLAQSSRSDRNVPSCQTVAAVGLSTAIGKSMFMSFMALRTFETFDSNPNSGVCTPITTRPLRLYFSDHART